MEAPIVLGEGVSGFVVVKPVELLCPILDQFDALDEVVQAILGKMEPLSARGTQTEPNSVRVNQTTVDDVAVPLVAVRENNLLL